jgi:hypothetical protein
MPNGHGGLVRAKGDGAEHGVYRASAGRRLGSCGPGASGRAALPFAARSSIRQCGRAVSDGPMFGGHRAGRPLQSSIQRRSKGRGNSWIPRRSSSPALAAASGGYGARCRNQVGTGRHHGRPRLLRSRPGRLGIWRPPVQLVFGNLQNEIVVLALGDSQTRSRRCWIPGNRWFAVPGS